ncbi:MAG: collagen-like protein, partial [Bacteroidota bacterium]
MKKNSITTMIIVTMLIYGISTMLTGCKGDQGDIGPAGADGTNGIAGINGTDGTAGVDGNVTCLECHSTAAKTQIDMEFVRSQHSSGSIAVEYAGGRASCSYCHSHEGYVEYVATGDVDQDFPAPSAWECATCHNIHSAMDATDYAFRMGTAV